MWFLFAVGEAFIHASCGQHGGEQRAAQGVALFIVFQRGLDGDGGHALRGGGIQHMGVGKLDASACPSSGR